MKCTCCGGEPVVVVMHLASGAVQAWCRECWGVLQEPLLVKRKRELADGERGREWPW